MSTPAQFTLVTGTVLDTSGLAYSCGTISASIVNLNGQNLYLNGAQFSAQPAAAKLGCPTDPTTSRTNGAFTMQLADNTQIKCGSGANIITCGTQTQWFFTVNNVGLPPPVGTGPQTCSAQITISGGSQSISASFSACPALSTISGASFPLLAPNGTVAAPSYSFTNSTNTGLFFEPAGSGFGGLAATALALNGSVIMDMNTLGVRITDNAVGTLFLNSAVTTGIKSVAGGSLTLVSGNRLKLIDQGTCTMAAGTCTAQSLASTYSVAPLCFATTATAGGTAGQLKAPSTTTTVTPASSNGADTATVNWICFGN